MAEPGAGREVERAQERDLLAIHSRVINVVGHELRTPVTVVHGLAEQLRAAPDLQTVTEQIAPALLRNTERLTRLLDDLLVASGISTAIPVERATPTDVASLITQRWAHLSDTELVIEGSGAALLPPRSATMVLDAVLANAAQYGTSTNVTVTPGDGAVTVTVTSRGGAASTDDLRMATEPFFRGEFAVTSRPGLGLGLAVADQVLERIGGGVDLSLGDAGEVVTTIEFVEVES